MTSKVLLLASRRRGFVTRLGVLSGTLALASPLKAETPPAARAATIGDGADKATADTATADTTRKPDWENAPATRRSGFTLGVGGGLVFGSARGYPNKVGQIGDPAYYASVSQVSSGGSLWLGGALTDWFVFAIGFGGGGWKNDGIEWSGGGVLFHVETFPLFTLGQTWRDVGLYADFGTGGGSIKDASGATLATGGGMSIAGFGAFWEPFRLFGGHVVTGPFAGFEYMGSDAVSCDIAMLGFRSVFYGGP